MANAGKPKPKRWFSLAALYGRYLRHCFAAAKLTQRKIDIDDGETTVQFWGPTSSSSKPALVFLHGYGLEAMWQWQPQVAFFSRDFAVYVPNLVFFGESTTRELPSDKSEVFQAVVVAKFMEKLGVERYSVVGTSYGGFVAYRMANMWPERVEKVVLASSAVNMRENDKYELLKRAKVDTIEELMHPTTAKQLRTLSRLATFHGLNKCVPNYFLNDLIDGETHVFLRVGQANTLPEKLAVKQAITQLRLLSENRKEKLELLKGLTLGWNDNVCLSPLQQDVLILWGEHDQIFLLEKAIELKEILGKNAKLEVIKNTSHVPQIEDAVQFNNIVKKFLQETS